MELRELFVALKDAREPSRDLDVEIANAVNYVEKHRGDGGPVVALSSVPLFTRFIADAMKLVEQVAPGVGGGFSWEPGMASAKIGDGPYIQASSPPIALCLAALRHRVAQG